ncbi:MAG: hypothetical protein IJ705_01640, partial [Oscillospiraceae bacterium]|nr:hypothetical protein [Oscillospiraceae bacterium]
EDGSAPTPGGEAGTTAQAAGTAAPEPRPGEQPEQTAGPQKDTKPTAEERRRAFRELINGEYKDLYTEETQRMLNRRFKEVGDLRGRLDSMQPVLDVLQERYGVDAADPQKLARAISDDSALWSQAAEQAGLTVEQYKQIRRLEAQNALLQERQRKSEAQSLANLQYNRWTKEAEELKGRYPEFSLESMQGNEIFYTLLKNNFPMEQAYRAASVDAIEQSAAQRAEKAITDNIRARGARPPEAGGSAAPAFRSKEDVSKLSDKDVLAILADISGGKKVSFS